MYPVTVMSGEMGKMEMVQTYHTAYAGFAGKRSGIFIEVRQCRSQAARSKSAVGAAEAPRSLGQVQFDVLLEHVQKIESEMTGCEAFADRRNLLGELQAELSLSEQDWQFVYATFLARNRSEIPHRREYEKKRRLAEKTVEYSGTERKQGRNWRYPGEMCFGIQIRQKQLFNNWTWPTANVTDVKGVFDVGPRNEQMAVTAQPPQGETWSTISDAQKIAVQESWSEERQSTLPNFGNPIPTMQEVRTGVSEFTQRVVEAKRSVDWTLNVMAISRSHFPSVCGKMYIRKTLKGLCNRTGL